METNKVPGTELAQRLLRFTNELDKTYDAWELCAIAGGVNMFYLTGTFCDGILLLRRGKDAVLWVRRSYERALLESEFPDIRQMNSFRDIAGAIRDLPDTLYLDTAHATMEWYSLLNKYLPFRNVLPVDSIMMKIRAVKSEYELERMRLAGDTIDRVLREEIPLLFRDGISAVELGVELFAVYMKRGHHGICRFSMRNYDTLLGHVAFGDDSLYPSAHVGASGVAGICPAVPVLGRRERLLREGDLVLIDVCFGVDGYHVDKTLIYSYKLRQPEYIETAHKHCLELERKVASILRTGARPSDIYSEIMESVEPDYRRHFMGAPGRNVPFIGHSIGLYTDETPVIAKGFNDPLERGMTFAIEPKMGFEGVGMIGSENTYLVTDDGGVCLTGAPMELAIITN